MSDSSRWLLLVHADRQTMEVELAKTPKGFGLGMSDVRAGEQLLFNVVTQLDEAVLRPLAGTLCLFDCVVCA